MLGTVDLMALREKLAQRSQPFLAPGERIQQVFMCQSGPNPLWFLMIPPVLMFFLVRCYVVVVTDRSIVLLKAGMIKNSFPNEIAGRMSRNTQLGPMSGIWASTLVADQKMNVHKRFHKDVHQADAWLFQQRRQYQKPQMDPRRQGPPPAPQYPQY